MRFLKWFFTGEVLFSGYLAGYVLTSAFPKLPNFTYTFFLLSFVVALNRLIKNPILQKKSLVPIFTYILLFIVFAISLFYTPSNEYAKEKITIFMSLTTWSFFGVFILIKTQDSLKRFLQGIVFFSFITALFMIGESIGTSFLRAGIGGSNNVISVGRIAGMGIIAVIGMYIYNGVKGYKKITSIAILLVLTIALLLTASRGPLIAVIISLLVFIPLSFRFSIKQMSLTFNKGIFSLIVITSLTTACLVPVANAGVFDTMFNRLNVFLQDVDGGDSVIARTDRHEVAKAMFMESPLIGNGIGSFPVYYGSLDYKDYPHNIFLEFLSEFGLLGFTLFVLLIGYALYVVFRYWRSESINVYQLVVIIMFIYLMINANISGDINTNKLLFTALALTAMLPLYKNRSTQ